MQSIWSHSILNHIFNSTAEMYTKFILHSTSYGNTVLGKWSAPYMYLSCKNIPVEAYLHPWKHCRSFLTSPEAPMTVEKSGDGLTQAA